MRRATVHLVVKRVIRTVSKPIGAAAPAATSPAPTPPPAVAPPPSSTPLAPPPATASVVPAAATTTASPAATVPTDAAAPRRRIVRRIIRRKKVQTASDAAAATPAAESPAPPLAVAPTPPVTPAPVVTTTTTTAEDDTASAVTPSAPEDEGAKTTVAKAPKERSAVGKSTAMRVATGKELYNELRGIDHHGDEAETTSRVGGRGGRKTPMVKAFRIDEILSVCDESDAIFARRLPTGGCQFFAWPGTPLAVASAAIVSMPDTIRTVHSVFGRSKVPIDLVMDIDCPVPQEHWSMSKIRPFQVKVLDDVLTVVTRELEKRGEEIESQVVLQSPNLKKASFHVHTKLKDAAFEDYESLHGFLHRFREEIPHVDLQIYRPNGMLRMFSCMKENRTSAMVVFDDPKWNIGFADAHVPDAAAALHSVCIREVGTFTRLLRFEPPRLGLYTGAHGSGPHGDRGGAAASDGLGHRPSVLLPRTELEAVTNAARWLRSATEAEVAEWRGWISLGLCAFRIGHHFNDAKKLPRPAMQEMLEAWIEASRHCPSKFKPGDCEARWNTFDISKLDARASWWGAYRHLGSLTVPMQEAIEHERELEKARTSGRYGGGASKDGNAGSTHPRAAASTKADGR